MIETKGLNVKIKKLHDDAVIPQYATIGAAGFDLVAVEDVFIYPGETKKVSLGLAFEIPEGYVMYICMRSGIGLKTKLRQSNGIGVIDSDYRGEVAMMFDNTSVPMGWTDTVPWKVDGTPDRSYAGDGEIDGTYRIRKGDRICQGIITEVPQATFIQVNELCETERGAGGFGSSRVRA